MLSLGWVHGTGASAQLSLRTASSQVTDSIQSLSSGNRLARTDAANMAVATGLKSLALEQREIAYNISRASSLLQAAETGMGLMQDMLQRLKELSVGASADVLDDDARAGYEVEARHIQEQLQQVADSTRFAGITVLNGNVPPSQETLDMPDLQLAMPLGGATAQFLTLRVANVEWASLSGGMPLSFTSSVAARSAQHIIDRAAQRVGEARAEVGGELKVLDFRLQQARSLMLYGQENYAELAETRIPEESTHLALARLREQASISLLAQVQALGSDMLALVDQQV